MVSYIVSWFTLFDSDPCSNSSTCPHGYYCEPTIITTTSTTPLTISTTPPTSTTSFTSTTPPNPSGFCMHGKFYDPINGYKIYSRHFRLLNAGSKSILHLYFDVAGQTCTKRKGIANNADFTRNLIGYSGTFATCFLSRQRNKYNGFTWDRKTHECFGIKNALDINDDYECCESCIFNGKLLFA